MGGCEEGNWSEDRERSKFQGRGASGNQVGGTEHEHEKDFEWKF